MPDKVLKELRGSSFVFALLLVPLMRSLSFKVGAVGKGTGRVVSIPLLGAVLLERDLIDSTSFYNIAICNIVH